MSCFSDTVYCKGKADSSGQSEITASQTNGRAAGVSYPNGLMEYQQEYPSPTGGHVESTIFTNMRVNGEPITSQSSFVLPRYSNELGKMPVYGHFGGDELVKSEPLSTPGTALGGAPLLVPGPGHSSTVGVGIEGYRDQCQPSVFQNQDPGYLGTRPVPGQGVESGWQTQDINQIAKMWQMMDMDNMEMWITSANEFE